MKLSKIGYTTLLVLIALAILLGISFFTYYFVHSLKNPTQTIINHQLNKADPPQKVEFRLVDPGSAPESIRDMVLLGYHIILDTQHYAKDYVGNRLNCTNCHFGAGDSIGGAQNGISLAGSATQYPDYDQRTKKVINLAERINLCFTRSIAGKRVPVESDTMKAVVTYLHWISKDLPMYGKIPWLGLKHLETTHRGDPKAGEEVYTKYCAICHLANGEGQDVNPPVWGDGSFNKQAGFNKEATLAAFIYWNMPYNDLTPVLTEEQSMDVAAYVLSKPRKE